MRKLFTSVVATAALGAALVVWVLPASAEPRTIQVTLADGTVVSVTVDVPPGTPLSDITIPVLPPSGGGPAQPSDPSGEPEGGGGDSDRDPREPEGEDESEQEGGGDDELVPLASPGEGTARENRRRDSDLRNADGSPTRSNPTFTEAFPGPAEITPIPNFVIRKFRVPIFLLPIYQAAGIQYGVRWEVLAAINEIETDYGRNLNVSSAGAVGWMQFLPSTWRAYGVDANKDGRKDPYNPVDAIFAAARYLKAAGAERDLRRAIFAYNHADWYVDSVMMRARLIAGIPGDLVGSLTGLTEGHFPVYARARYADDVAEREAERRARRGSDASQEVEGSGRRDISIFAREGAPVVAVNDGVIKAIGEDAERGRYIVLQDAYGNRYSYNNLGTISQSYPVPRENEDSSRPRAPRRADDEAPTRPASAGRQLDDSDTASAREGEEPGPSVAIPQRLFADPSRPSSRRNGGAEQILDARAQRGGFTTFKNYFSRPFGIDAEDVRLKPLIRGARVIGGTILGRIGPSADGTTAPHVNFAIRPAGHGARRIDPKPILDGWKLLEATAVYRASGRNVLYGDDEDDFSIGQIFLLPKHLLERRVLSDERIEIYPCGRQDIRSGQIDRRVLATLAFLAESGLRPTVTSLRCGHSVYTRSGNISHHSSGNAVDIARLNGVPILGHQEPGGITEQAVRRIMQLQGTLRPDQIISLFRIGGPTFAMADHADHIHVGFRPLFGANRRTGRQARAILGLPGGADWGDLVEQLRSIENPVVPTRPSEFSIEVERRRPRRSSDAHSGE